MGVPESFDHDNGPALPDLSSHLGIGRLAARLCDLTGQAKGLSMPWAVTVDEAAQMLALEFGSAEQSLTDVAAWAARFGGVLQSHPCSAFTDPTRHVTCSFTYQGATVLVFAFIPETPDTWTAVEDQS